MGNNVCCSAAKGGEKVTTVDPTSEEQVQADPGCEPEVWTAPPLRGPNETRPDRLREFEFTIERGADEPLGLDVDLTDVLTAQICGLKPGPILKYTEKAASNAKLEPGDFLLAVNGHSKAEPMWKALSKELKLTLRIGTPLEMLVRIDKNQGSLGVDIHFAPNGVALVIQQINPGLMMSWNKEHPDCTIKPHDRIMRVNSAMWSPSAMLLEFNKAEGVVELLCVRPPKM
mmetsp:Transcript_55187/g.118605  ORF Transcript_55187/g.118605 Transcript_55187/m.118605 type:complete len:229 (-) Transcript_55187:35-721(-)